MKMTPSFRVQMDIVDVLYLSWFIPEKRLRPAVSPKVPFALLYQDNALISLVLFRSSNVAASLMPFLRFSYDQANIRTYIIDPVSGKPAVFFLRSGITSSLVSVATRALSIPWGAISMSIEAGCDTKGNARYRAQGMWEGRFSIEVAVSSCPALNMTPFQSVEEASRFITSPAIGCYGTSEKLIRFEVNHSPIDAVCGALSSVQCPVLVSSGLLTEQELARPHSALIAPHARFTVFMPPATLSL